MFCHQNADPDAVCSAYVLKSLITKLAGTNVSILCPEGVSAPTKRLVHNLGILIEDAKLPDDFDLAVLVDTNTLDQLGETADVLRGQRPKLIVVDHHHAHPDTERIASQMIVDENAAAAAEVVFNLFRASKEPLGRLDAMALMAAIFVETKHFLLARKSTFQVASKLMAAGADPRHLADVLNSPMSRSERIARLKAASRTSLAMHGNWVLATSELGSYQSSAARGLLGLGAHVALVGGASKDRARVNMRSTEGFHRKTGVHLGRDIAIPVGKSFKGAGGGHPTAAGLSAPANLEDILAECAKRIGQLVGSESVLI